MSKSKWSADFRTKVAKEYLDGKGSFYYLADKYHTRRMESMPLSVPPEMQAIPVNLKPCVLRKLFLAAAVLWI